MLKRLCFLVFLLVQTAGLRAQITVPDSVYFNDYHVQTLFRDSVNHLFAGLDSAGAARIINNLMEEAGQKGDKPLQYGLQITWYTRVAYNGKKDLHLEGDFKTLIDELEEYNIPKLKAEALNVFGIYYWQRERYASAFEKFIEAYNVYSPYTSKEFPLKRTFLFDFASKYYHFRDFYTAKKYLLQAYAAVEPPKTKGVVTILNTLGMCYMNEANNDSAQYYFNKAYTIAVKEKSDIWQAIISGNIAHVYLLQGKYKEAIPLLEKDWKESIKGEPSSAANSLAMLGGIYAKLGDAPKAMDYARRAMDVFYSHPGVRDNYGMKRNIYPQLATAFAANGDMATAYAYMDSTVQAKDTLAKRANAMVLAGVQYNMEAARKLEENARNESERRLNFWTRNGLIAAVILVIIIMVLVVNRQRMKYGLEQEKLLNEKKLARAELEKAVLQLSEFTKILSEKNLMIEKITADLQKLHAEMGIDTSREEEMLQKLRQSAILTESQWKNFQNMFDTVYAEFSGRLKQKVRGLSPVETRFMVLSKLRLPDIETANILGISTEAVSLNKQKLREKLDLPEGATLESFADTI